MEATRKLNGGNNLAASIGIVVLATENIPYIRKQGKAHEKQSDEEIMEWLKRKAVKWISDARPIVRWEL